LVEHASKAAIEFVAHKAAGKPKFRTTIRLIPEPRNEVFTAATPTQCTSILLQRANPNSNHQLMQKYAWDSVN
jgi:hypothetical protein